MSKNSPVNREISHLIARYTDTEGEVATAIDSLFLSKRTGPSQPMHAAQWPFVRASVSSEITALVSPCSTAVANRPTRSRSSMEPGIGAR